MSEHLLNACIQIRFCGVYFPSRICAYPIGPIRPKDRCFGDNSFVLLCTSKWNIYEQKMNKKWLTYMVCVIEALETKQADNQELADTLCIIQ